MLINPLPTTPLKLVSGASSILELRSSALLDAPNLIQHRTHEIKGVRRIELSAKYETALDLLRKVGRALVRNSPGVVFMSVFSKIRPLTSAILFQSLFLFSFLLLCPDPISAANTVAVSSSVRVPTVPDPLAVGKRLRDPQRLTTMTLDELMLLTTGDVSDQAIKKHLDFESYYKANRTSREGKALEAIAAYTVNRRQNALGNNRRWVTTASLKSPGHPADILELDTTGKIKRQIQAGTGHQNVLQKLTDSRYGEMAILTDQDTYSSLQEELKKRIAKSNVTGKPLSPAYATLRSAMESDRLMPQLPCGAPLPLRSEFAKVSRAFAKGRYAAKFKALPKTSEVKSSRRIASTPPAKKAPNTAAIKASKLRGLPKSAKVLGPVGGVVDAGIRANDARKVEQQYRAGNLSRRERNKAHVKNGATGVGGWAGAWAGAEAGTIAGGVAGSCFCPGAGTGVGAVIGAIGGGIAGYWAGDTAAEVVVDAAMKD